MKQLAQAHPGASRPSCTTCSLRYLKGHLPAAADRADNFFLRREFVWRRSGLFLSILFQAPSSAQLSAPRSRPPIAPLRERRYSYTRLPLHQASGVDSGADADTRFSYPQATAEYQPQAEDRPLPALSRTYPRKSRLAPCAARLVRFRW